MLFLAQSGLCSLTAFGVPELPRLESPPAQASAEHRAAPATPEGCHGGPARPAGDDVPGSGDEQCRDHCRLYSEVVPGSAATIDLGSALYAVELASVVTFGSAPTQRQQRFLRTPPRKLPLLSLNSVLRI